MTYAVMLTALSLEYEAVRAHLTGLEEVAHETGTLYETGTFDSGDKTLAIAIAQTGKGNAAAARETERALSYFKPEIALFVGIAGGVKDVELSDVVVGDSAHRYEAGRAESEFWPKPSSHESSYDLVQRARAEARGSAWLQRVRSTSPPETAKMPQVHVGPIASGEKTVASTQSSVFNLLRSSYGDCLALDMEGYGFLEATHANPGVGALLIRGISDLLDDKTRTDKAGYQQIAAQNASAFAFEVLLATTRVSTRLVYELRLTDDRQQVLHALRGWRFLEVPVPGGVIASSSGLRTGSTTTTTFHCAPVAKMTDCSVECDVRIIEHADDLSRWVGVRVRGWHDDIRSGYLAYLRASGTVELYRGGEILGGHDNPIVEDTKHAWTRLRVEVLRDRIQVFVNGQLHLETVDKAFGEGYIYLHTFGTAGEFANLTVSELT